MDYMELKKDMIKDLPYPESISDVGYFDSLIIVPTRRRHDSGYMCMDFITIKDGEPKYRLSGWSDVLHIDGIGGYGSIYVNDVLGDYSKRAQLKSVECKGWSIDCLPCGCLRLFCNSKLFIESSPLSDCEIYAHSRLSARKG